jgi:hypothetical protein
MKEVAKESTNSANSISTRTNNNSDEGKIAVAEATKFHTDCQKEHEASLECEICFACFRYYIFYLLFIIIIIYLRIRYQSEETF